MQALTVMQRLAATTSRVEKEQIIFDAFMDNCRDFFIGAKLATDQLVTFGVKKVAEIIEDDGAAGDLTFDDFLDLANKLQTRQLTGNAARDAIHDAAARCHAPTWNMFYRRILLKDLNVGVTEATLNKVLKKLLPAYPHAEEFLIPVFACQLAHDGEDDAHKKKVKGKKLVDTKLDGMRTLAVMNKEAGTVTLYTRNGQTIETFPELQQSLNDLLSKLPGSIVLDGELMSPKGFQHLMTLVKRKEGSPDTASIRYALFDIIPLKCFLQGYSAKPQIERRAILESLVENGLFVDLTPDNLKRLYVVPQIEVDLDTEEGRAAFNEYNRQVIADGYEGIMIKDPNAPYEGKRTAAWLKKKPKISVTLEIVDVEQGKPDGKYADTLGALVCAGTDNGVDIRTNVSGGMSDEDRNRLWKSRKEIIGMMVEIEADKLTLEEGTSVYSLRFPVFKGFRGTKPGEKL